MFTQVYVFLIIHFELVFFYADPNAEKPSPTSPPFTITPSPFPSPSQPGTGATVGATASETRGGDSGSITEIVVPAVAGVVIVALVVIIVVLVVYLRRHRTVEATVRPLTLPLPRAGRAIHIATCFLFLCSEDLNFVAISDIERIFCNFGEQLQQWEY